MIDLALIHMWTEQLCTLPDGTAKACAVELGLGETVLHQGNNMASIEPPPAGATRVIVVTGNHGVDRVAIDLEHGFTRAQIDRELGVGDNLPLGGPSHPHVRRHIRTEPGLPNRCVVLAEFKSVPEPGTVTTRLILRREPA